MSEFASARTADLSAALAALTAELDDRPIDGGDYDHITPILSHLTIGHLRQIAAALAAPYFPGYVACDKATWSQAMADDKPGVIATEWDGPDSAGNDFFFERPAVTS